MRIEHFPALGTHIDLDHIISVSDVYLTTIPAHSRHVGFQVQYVLRDGPVDYVSAIRDGSENPEFRYVWTSPNKTYADGSPKREIIGEEWLYSDGQWTQAPKHSPPERPQELACVVRWQAVANHLIERWRNPKVFRGKIEFVGSEDSWRKQAMFEGKLDHPTTCTCRICVTFGINGAHE